MATGKVYDVLLVLGTEEGEGRDRALASIEFGQGACNTQDLTNGQAFSHSHM